MAEEFTEVPPGWEYVPGQGWVPPGSAFGPGMSPTEQLVGQSLQSSVDPTGGAGGSGVGPREPAGELPDEGMTMVPPGTPGRVEIPEAYGGGWEWQERLSPEELQMLAQQGSRPAPGGAPAQPTGGMGAPAAPKLSPELAGQFGGKYYPQGADYPDWLADKLGVPRNADGSPAWGSASSEVQRMGSLAMAQFEEQRRGPVGRLQREQETRQGFREEREGYAQELEGFEGGRRQEAGAQAYMMRGAMLRQREEQKVYEEQRRMADAFQRQNIDKADRQARDFKIDPDRLFKQKGGGAVFFATLGIALAEFGRVFGGGQRNVALEIVQRAIDRDIEAQKNEVWRLRDDVAAKKNMYGMMRQVHADERMAEVATRKELYGAFADYMEDQAGLIGDERRKALAKEAASKTRELGELERLKVEGFASDLAEAEARARAQMLMQASAARAKDKEALGEWEPVSDKESNLIVPHLGIASAGASDKEMRELRQGNADLSQAMYAATHLEKLLQDPTRLASPTERAEARQWKNILLAPEIRKRGANFTEREAQLLDDMLGVSDPSSVMSWDRLRDSSGLLRNRMGSLKQQFASQAKALGVRPVEISALRNPKTGRTILYKREMARGTIQGPEEKKQPQTGYAEEAAPPAAPPPTTAAPSEAVERSAAGATSGGE